MPEASSQEPQDDSRSEFEEAANRSDPGILREFVQFLIEDKKWWLTPILVITALLMLIAFLATTPAAPFIYTLF